MTPPTEIRRKIRVLVVDDSAIVRKILTTSLESELDIEVVGTAPDPVIAQGKLRALKPDVMTLDIEMPQMDGLTFLGKLMKSEPLPVIVISSVAQSGCANALRALEAGAVDVLAKPNGPYSVGELSRILADKVRAAARARPRRSAVAAVATVATRAEPVVRPRPLGGSFANALIAIGASTGGTEAIRQVLQQIPADCPPILIVQHIPPVFSKAFADRLNQLCAMSVREASDGDRVLPGLALVAPGDLHMVLRRDPSGFRVEARTGPRVCYQRPSVDVLFRSVAAAAGSKAIGVILTGMGSDGAAGLKAMLDAGAETFGQDEATSVVYGMPREAAALGAVRHVLPLHRIGAAVCSAARIGAAAARA